MATWSFNPTLPSDKITTAETNGKLVITVLPGKFTSDTAYTVTYNDGNGCSASTKFYIKNDCSGGGGGGGDGKTGTCKVTIINNTSYYYNALSPKAKIRVNGCTNGINVDLKLSDYSSFGLLSGESKSFNNVIFSADTLVTGKTICTDCDSGQGAAITKLYSGSTNLQDLDQDKGRGYVTVTANSLTLIDGGVYTFVIKSTCKGSSGDIPVTAVTIEADGGTVIIADVGEISDECNTGELAVDINEGNFLTNPYVQSGHIYATVDPNDGGSRTATVTLKTVDGALTKCSTTFNVTQNGSGGGGGGNTFKSFTLTNSSTQPFYFSGVGMLFVEGSPHIGMYINVAGNGIPSNYECNKYMIPPNESLIWSNVYFEVNGGTYTDVVGKMLVNRKEAPYEETRLFLAGYGKSGGSENLTHMYGADKAGNLSSIPFTTEADITYEITSIDYSEFVDGDKTWGYYPDMDEHKCP